MKLASSLTKFLVGGTSALGVVVVSASLSVALADRAAAQAVGRTVDSAYGRRVSGSRDDAGSATVESSHRVIARLPTRIESRINSRIDRYDQRTESNWAYAMPDDNSRRGTNISGRPGGVGLPQPVDPSLSAGQALTTGAGADPQQVDQTKRDPRSGAGR